MQENIDGAACSQVMNIWAFFVIEEMTFST